MASNKSIIVLGFSIGDEEVLKASLAAWQKHFENATIVVVGEKYELPKGIQLIECAHINGEEGIAKKIAAAAKAVEAESFVYAHNAYPLQQVTLADIDKAYCNPHEDPLKPDFTTRLPRLYNKQKVLDLKVPAGVSFEQAYSEAHLKGRKQITLRDLSDTIRLQVFGLKPDEYRTKHLLKHKKFLVTTRYGIKAVQRLIE